jgi:hypothetical protein
MRADKNCQLLAAARFALPQDADWPTQTNQRRIREGGSARLTIFVEDYPATLKRNGLPAGNRHYSKGLLLTTTMR